MSKPSIPFEQLVTAARREPIPPCDVAERVAQSLRIPVRPMAGDRPLWIATALAIAAAVAVMAMVSQHDPLVGGQLAEQFFQVVPTLQ